MTNKVTPIIFDCIGCQALAEVLPTADPKRSAENAVLATLRILYHGDVSLDEAISALCFDHRRLVTGK